VGSASRAEPQVKRFAASFPPREQVNPREHDDVGAEMAAPASQGDFATAASRCASSLATVVAAARISDSFSEAPPKNNGPVTLLIGSQT
jgi:hypothetical protein